MSTRLIRIACHFVFGASACDKRNTQRSAVVCVLQYLANLLIDVKQKSWLPVHHKKGYKKTGMHAQKICTPHVLFSIQSKAESLSCRGKVFFYSCVIDPEELRCAGNHIDVVVFSFRPFPVHKAIDRILFVFMLENDAANKKQR